MNHYAEVHAIMPTHNGISVGNMPLPWRLCEELAEPVHMVTLDAQDTFENALDDVFGKESW